MSYYRGGLCLRCFLPALVNIHRHNLTREKWRGKKPAKIPTSLVIKVMQRRNSDAPSRILVSRLFFLLLSLFFPHILYVLSFASIISEGGE